MSAPVVWIIFPLVVSGLMLVFLNHPRFIRILGLLLGALLSGFALLQPIGNVLNLGFFSIDINPELAFLGRSFLLENTDRFTLLLIFTTLSLYIGGVNFTDQPSKFIPLSIAVAAVLTSAIAVQPFLYSAVLVELAVILMIPMVTVQGDFPQKGVIRFLIYLSLAMPFILLAGWILGGSQTSLSDESMRSLAALFLSIGFAFWLAIFPFHTWVPQFAMAVNPYMTGFIFGLLPVVTLLIMLDYSSSLIWLREAGYLSMILRTVGIIMIVTSGVWAAIETELRKILAFSVLYETGFSLLMVSQQTNNSIILLHLSFIPRIFGLAVLSFAFALIWNLRPTFKISDINSMMKMYPFVSLSILLSLFSIVGFPASAGFPYKFETLQALSPEGPIAIIWSLIGFTGLLIGVIRIISSITIPRAGKWEIHESISQIVFLSIGCIVLIILGLFPHIIDSLLSQLLINLPVLQ